jgi:hypothetical protein
MTGPEQGLRSGLRAAAKIGCAVAHMPRSEFTAFMVKESKKWERLIPAMGIPVID